MTSALKNGMVYLIPSVLHEQGFEAIPAYIAEAVIRCSAFFVENERTARRYLKAIWREMNIDAYEWHVIHKAEESTKSAFLNVLKQGKTVGIISEAGCPGIADPGQILVAAAQSCGAVIKPLVGPNSIILALMASGMNGQHFRFRGYLPIEPGARTKAIKAMEAEAKSTNCTQIFIETPYRNNKLLDALLSTCHANTRLCLGIALTAPDESVKTKMITDWKKQKPELNKKPVIFLLSAS